MGNHDAFKTLNRDAAQHHEQKRRQISSKDCHKTIQPLCFGRLNMFKRVRLRIPLPLRASAVFFAISRAMLCRGFFASALGFSGGLVKLPTFARLPPRFAPSSCSSGCGVSHQPPGTDGMTLIRRFSFPADTKESSSSLEAVDSRRRFLPGIP